MSLLEVRKLRKQYGNIDAVKGISFDMTEGRCVSLIGPNGAGKTTTLKMLSHLLAPTDGSIRFPGLESRDIRHHIGYLPQYPAFYNWMSGLEFLEYVGQLSHMPRKETKQRAQYMLEQVGIAAAGKRKIGGYSGGMKQRLGIAQAMIHHPKLVILDEPVSALDPIGRREVLELLRTLKHDTTILFSTHVLHDAEEICDDILIMNHGEIIVSGSLRQVREQHQQPIIHVQADQSLEAAAQSIRLLPSVQQVEINERTIRIHVRDLNIAKREVLSLLVSERISINKFEVAQTSLEDLFMKVVKA